jgi:endonuclease YncB( thermonuclease family)
MRSIFALALAVAIGLFAIARAQNRMIEGIPWIADGDTIVIADERVRLHGFDAPERGHRCAGGVNPWSLARDELARFIDRRAVSCEIVGRDARNSRPVARCSVGGVELGDHMVREGWARDWPIYSCGAYGARERLAHEASRGLWGMSCPALWGARDYTTRCRKR